MLIYILMFSTFVPLLQCHTINDHDGSNCNFLGYIDADVSLELQKAGFHRELVTTVKFNKYGFLDKVLLVYRWPKDIYVDPFQLLSLGDQRNWKMLLGSAVDLEMPAHKSSEFFTYLYPHLEESTVGQIKLMFPIHGRYQKPSFSGAVFNSVVIHPPDLLLRTDQNCTQSNHSETSTFVDAPCTALNSSTCHWIKVHYQQLPGSVTLHLPVGDASIDIIVCGGTLLVTIICCAALSILSWTHQIM